MAFDPNKRRMQESSQMANSNPYFNAPAQPQKNSGNLLKIVVGIFIVFLVIGGVCVALNMSANKKTSQKHENNGQAIQNNTQNLTEVEIFNVE